MTDAQAWYAMMRYLRRHWEAGWTIEMLIDAGDNSRVEDAAGTPVSFDPGEWQSWVECVDEELGRAHGGG